MIKGKSAREREIEIERELARKREIDRERASERELARERDEGRERARCLSASSSESGDPPPLTAESLPSTVHAPRDSRRPRLN